MDGEPGRTDEGVFRRAVPDRGMFTLFDCIHSQHQGLHGRIFPVKSIFPSTGTHHQ